MADRYAHSPDVAWVDETTRIVVLRLDDLAAEPLLLDPVAAAVWRALEPGIALDDLVEDLASTFDVDPAAMRNDVTALLSDLERLRLVVVAP